MKKLYMFTSMVLTAMLLISTQVSAQENIYKISLEEKVQKSSLIVEGKVKSRQSFWNAAHTMIYTSNLVEVYKVFKGSIDTETIEVLTQGGSVGNVSLEASDLLNLEHVETGVFFCSPNSLAIRNPSTNKVLWDVYASGQGFIHYNMVDKSAAAPFAVYSSIETKLYPAITALTARGIENKRPDVDLFHTSANSVASVINTYSPATLWAGALLSPANNLITINGSGFGAPNANTAILFPNANNGGMTNIVIPATDPLVVSWTDAQIQVRTPSLAGSGMLQVRDATNTTTIAGPINVVFSALTATFTVPAGGIDYVKESNLMNDNGTGGYTVVYSNSTAGGAIDMSTAPAKATFQRALTTWKEIAGFNVTEGGTTSSQLIANMDNQNVIMYDNTNTGTLPLASGVLAVCYSWNNICGPNYAANQLQKTEFDIVVRNAGVSTGNTAFEVGPCPPNSTNANSIDLETVILHELGHALNLGHVNDPEQYSAFAVGQINPAKLMHYAVTVSVRRTTPDYSAKFGANYLIAPQGNTYGSCGLANTEMTPLATIAEPKDDCPLTFPMTALSANTSISFDMVHTTSNRFVDPSYLQIRCDGLGGPVTNNAYYAFKTGPVPGNFSVAVSGYTTFPTALAACPQIYAGAVPSGFRLNLYQVNTCPGGGLFPPVFACRTFTGNGVVTPITGLAANATYLLYLEALESTKATFTLLLNGSALPLRISAFSGKVISDYNQLQWTLSSTDVNTLDLEKSADGIHFEKINSANYSASVTRNDQFKDYRPYAGITYYRLAATNTSGQKEYSNIVSLKRNDAFMASIYPNPVKGQANISIITKDNGQYRFNVYNSTGQLVQQDLKQIGVQQQVQLNTNKLAAGSYLVKIYGPDNMLKKSISFIVSE